jgi:trehalose utilization protein
MSSTKTIGLIPSKKPLEESVSCKPYDGMERVKLNAKDSSKIFVRLMG